jgi:hypothetical protein
MINNQAVRKVKGEEPAGGVFSLTSGERCVAGSKRNRPSRMPALVLA